jgi:chitinase
MNRNSKDTANYLKMVQQLRKSLDVKYPKVHKLITLAVGTSPFNDEKQRPIKKLNKSWASAVDSFYVMVGQITSYLFSELLLTRFIQDIRCKW